jgi:cytochrome c553
MKKLLTITTLAFVSATLSASAADGAALFTKSCAGCHGADGKGATTMGKKLKIKDYTDAKTQSELTDAAASKAIKEGVKDKDGKMVMKAQAGLSDDDVKALVKHFRSFKK